MEANNFKLEFTTAAGVTEVSQAPPETVNDRLNRLARECGYNNISTSAVHIIREENQPTGVEILYNRRGDEAFTLSSPIAARIIEYSAPGRNIVPEEYHGTVAIKRIMIGYMALSRINTIADMQRVMTPLINEAVKDFIDEFGFIRLGYSITAQRPGLDNENLYFRDMDNMAAIEFRLCLIKN
jgi:hypothetical protein